MGEVERRQAIAELRLEAMRHGLLGAPAPAQGAGLKEEESISGDELAAAVRKRGTF
jgi:hypothetical protein